MRVQLEQTNENRKRRRQKGEQPEQPAKSIEGHVNRDSRKLPIPQTQCLQNAIDDNAHGVASFKIV